MNTIHSLRKFGFHVKVRHERRFKLFVPDVKDVYVTKGDMKFNNDDYLSLIDHIKEQIKFTINNNGGFTRVSILRKGSDEVLASGMTECSEKDNFNKKTAILKASCRALGQLMRNHPDEFSRYQSFLTKV